MNGWPIGSRDGEVRSSRWLACWRAAWLGMFVMTCAAACGCSGDEEAPAPNANAAAGAAAGANASAGGDAAGGAAPAELPPPVEAYPPVPWTVPPGGLPEGPKMADVVDIGDQTGVGMGGKQYVYLFDGCRNRFLMPERFFERTIDG